MNNPSNTSRQKLFAAITVAISIVCGILLVEYLLGWYRQSVENSSQLDNGIMQYHRTLGWTLTPNWQGKHQHHDFEVTYQHNKKGFRQQPDEDQPGTGHTIALLGDSFTYGFGVNNDETFAAQLAKTDKENVYLNFGVPGYSTDQQFLLMGQQSLVQGKTQMINHYVLVFYLGNDILDNMLPHPLQAEPAKPYFITADGNLTLKNVPVPKTRKPAALRSTTLTDLVFGDELTQYQTLTDYFTGKSEILKWLLPKTAKAGPDVINDILGRRLADHKKLLFTLFIGKIK